MRSLWVASTGTWLRGAVVCFVLAVSSLLGQGLAVLPWAFLLFLVDLSVGRLLANQDTAARRGEAFVLVMAGAIAAGVSLWINAAPVPDVLDRPPGVVLRS